MDYVREVLEPRWREIFTALGDGRDVAPTLRLRTEGMMQAAVLLGIASEECLVQAMVQVYREALERGPADDFGQYWQEFFPFPQIPGVGPRAPVYPGTAD